MIELSQITNLGAFSSTHHMVTELPDGMRHWTLTGIADLSNMVNSTDAEWQRKWVLLTLQIPGAGERFVRLQQWAPLVTLDAIRRDGNSADAGWAVESFHVMDGDLHQIPAHPGALMRDVTIGCGIKVRGVDGYVLRLGYSLHLVGMVE